MFCRYCGSNVDDGSAFCPKCGKKLVENTQRSMENVKVSKADVHTVKSKPNFKKVAIIVMCVLLACGLIELGVYIGYNLYTKHTISKYIEYVKNDDFQSANSMYYGKLDSNNTYVKSIIKELDIYLDEIKNDMYEGSKTYNECMEDIQTVNSLGIEYLATSIVGASDYVQDVNSNNLLVTQADECFNNKDYINAISIYSSVTENSSKYSEVQDKISKSKEFLVQDVLDKAQTLREEHKYFEAMDLVNVVLEIVPDDSTLNTLIEEIEEENRQYYVDHVLSNAKDSVSSKDVDKMISSLKDIYTNLSLYDNISENKDIKEAKTVCLDGIKSKINGYIKKSDIENASNIINDTLKIMADDEQDYFAVEQAQILNLVDTHYSELISKNKDYSGALEYLKNVYELNPTNSDIFNLYQDVFDEQSKFEKPWNGTIVTKDRTGVTLRKSASKTSKEVIHVNDNNIVSVISTFGEWYKVNYQGNEGYILKSYVKNYG